MTSLFFSKRRSTSVPPSPTSPLPSPPSPSPAQHTPDPVQFLVQVQPSPTSHQSPIPPRSVPRSHYPYNATPSLLNLPRSEIAPLILTLTCSACKEKYSTQVYTTDGKRKAPICHNCFRRFASEDEPVQRQSSGFTSFPRLLEDANQVDALETGYGYTGLKMVTGMFSASSAGRKSEESSVDKVDKVDKLDRGRSRSASATEGSSSGRNRLKEIGGESESESGHETRSASIMRDRGEHLRTSTDSDDSSYTIIPHS